jgi:formate--tetrahydrofolate ligase
MALKVGDYAITEAGFGGDLGAEKFLDIKCRTTGLRPSAVVVVATIRALKMHGGLSKTELATENLSALEKGIPNLLKHVYNMQKVYGMPVVVAVNKFPTDTDNEVAFIIDECKKMGVNTVLSNVWAEGGNGAIDLAKEVVKLADGDNDFTFAYDEKLPIKEKIEQIVKKVYRGRGVAFTKEADEQIERLTLNGYDKLPVCIAKSQYSFSDNPKLLGAPEGFTVTVKKVKISAGAGFVVVLTGNIMTMPGLPKVPSATKIDVDDDGVISGLF